MANVLNNEAGGTINANSSVAGQELAIYAISSNPAVYPLTINNDGMLEASNVGTLFLGAGTGGKSITNNGTIEARDSGTVVSQGFGVAPTTGRSQPLTTVRGTLTTGPSLTAVR